MPRSLRPTTPGYVEFSTVASKVGTLDQLIRATRDLKLFDPEEIQAQDDVIASSRQLLKRTKKWERLHKDDYLPLRRLVRKHVRLAWVAASRKQDDGVTLTALQHRDCPEDFGGVGYKISLDHRTKIEALASQRPGANYRRVHGLPPYAAVPAENTNKEQS